MSSLFGSLEIAKQSLSAQQFGLEITQRNIANANSPGYSRQRVNFTPADGSGSDNYLVNAGLSEVSVDAYRDRFLDYRISEELQGQGEQEASLSAVQQIEGLLNEGGSRTLQTAVSNFYNSFAALSNTPEDMTLRRQVLSQAGELASEFNRVYEKIQAVQTAQDRAVSDTISEINSITSGIADLNVKVAQAQATNSDSQWTLKDDRQRLIERLSGLVDLSYFETETGMITAMTKQGALLVVGDQSHPMQAATVPGRSFLQVTVDGQDVTSMIQSGKLGGLLKMRDTVITRYLTMVDDMAAGVIARTNDQHVLGTDFNGSDGVDFWTPFVQAVPGSNAGAARTMAVAISDPKQIAAAGRGKGPGNSDNAAILARIKDEPLAGPGTATADQSYAALLFDIGAELRDKLDAARTQKDVIVQLQNQRESFSGVNLDDEAVNIIKYQKAYEASARFVHVLDTLSDELVHLLGG